MTLTNLFWLYQKVNTKKNCLECKQESNYEDVMDMIDCDSCKNLVCKSCSNFNQKNINKIITQRKTMKGILWFCKKCINQKDEKEEKENKEIQELSKKIEVEEQKCNILMTLLAKTKLKLEEKELDNLKMGDTIYVMNEEHVVEYKEFQCKVKRLNETIKSKLMKSNTMIKENNELVKQLKSVVNIKDIGNDKINELESVYQVGSVKVHKGANETEIGIVQGENDKINEIEIVKVHEGVNEKINEVESVHTAGSVNLHEGANETEIGIVQGENDKINEIEIVKVHEGVNEKINEVESVHTAGSVNLHEGENSKINKVEGKIIEVGSTIPQEVEVFHNITTIITERNNQSNKERECWYFNNSKCRYGDRCKKIHKMVQAKYPNNVKQKNRGYQARPRQYRVENQYKRYNEQKEYTRYENTEDANSYRRGVIQNGIHRERNERTESDSPIRNRHINQSNTRRQMGGKDITQDFLAFLRRKNAMPLSRYMNTRQIK